MSEVSMQRSRHDSAFMELEKPVSAPKVVVYETVTAIEAIEEDEVPTVVKTYSLDEIKPSQPDGHRRTRSDGPKPSRLDKFREYTRVASERAKSVTKESNRSYNALSLYGKFAHDFVEPFSTWSGKNNRIIMSPCLSSVKVQEADGSAKAMINAASQNYAGFYEMTPQSNELQRMALERLPVADAASIPLIMNAVDSETARFFGADFSITTSTGYGSNYMALPAIIDDETLVILDENCHNSLLTGTCLAQPGLIQKFPHNDAIRLEEILKQHHREHNRIVLIIEGMYGMEGDIPPLNDIRRLKEVYNFIIFCDEAHSFLSIGSTGRGCIQHWNEEYPETLVPEDLIDLRTATFSKAVGGVGGFICGRSEFAEPIRRRLAKLEQQGCETVATSQLIQVLWVLGQPTRTARHLHRLADIARFCRTELERFGIHVYGDDGTHILPIHTGRLTLAAKLSYILRGKAVLAVPISAPAVPYWKSRIRLNLSASLTDGEVNKLLAAVIDGCRDVGICKHSNVARRTYCSPLRHETNHQEELETAFAFKKIIGLIGTTANNLLGKEHLVTSKTQPGVAFDHSVIQRGHNAQATYGLGSGGARSILTFPPHLAVECLMARRMSMEACLTFPDSHIGLSSTIAALSRPLIGYEKHYFILPRDAPSAIEEGLTISSSQGRLQTVRYEDPEELSQQIEVHSKASKTYFTVYVRDAGLLPKICKLKPPSVGMTILIDTQAIPRAMQLKPFTNLLNVEILVYGSFHRAIGLPGGFVAGSEILINELRHTNRGYMFTTSTQPFIMEMVRASLEKKVRINAA